MSEGNIEILGQKLSYPNSWHGVAGVFLVCLTVVVVAYFVKGWATPEVLQGLSGLASTTKEQEKTNEELSAKMELLVNRVANLESQLAKLPGSPGKIEFPSAADQSTWGVPIDLSTLKSQISTQKAARVQKIDPLFDEQYQLRAN